MNANDKPIFSIFEGTGIRIVYRSSMDGFRNFASDYIVKKADIFVLCVSNRSQSSLDSVAQYALKIRTEGALETPIGILLNETRSEMDLEGEERVSLQDVKRVKKQHSLQFATTGLSLSNPKQSAKKAISYLKKVHSYALTMPGASDCTTDTSCYEVEEEKKSYPSPSQNMVTFARHATEETTDSTPREMQTSNSVVSAQQDMYNNMNHTRVQPFDSSDL